jgi:hypothetical protein
MKWQKYFSCVARCLGSFAEVLLVCLLAVDNRTCVCVCIGVETIRGKCGTRHMGAKIWGTSAWMTT